MNIYELAQQARPIDYDDLGSERQIEAFNLFFAETEKLLTRSAFEALEDYGLKSTNDELIDEALRRLDDIDTLIESLSHHLRKRGCAFVIYRPETLGSLHPTDAEEIAFFAIERELERIAEEEEEDQ